MKDQSYYKAPSFWQHGKMDNRIIYIMGVSGSGKTTVGKILAAKMQLPFFDADDFHSAANKDKMRAGIALNDDDRKDWLLRLNQLAKEQSAIKGAIIACSALKDKYREVLKDGVPQTSWIFLQGTYEQIYARLQQRQGHYMPASLLASQFESLEIPADAYTVSIDNNPQVIAEQILAHLQSAV
ncbi:gluconokinase [Ferruginibacter sp.]